MWHRLSAHACVHAAAEQLVCHACMQRLPVACASILVCSWLNFLSFKFKALITALWIQVWTCTLARRCNTHQRRMTASRTCGTCQD